MMQGRMFGVAGRLVAIVLILVEGVVEVGLAQAHVLREVGSEEALAQTQVHAAAYHMLGGIEVLGSVGRLGLQTDAEDAQLVEAHSLALEQQLTQTVLHLDEHATDGGL